MERKDKLLEILSQKDSESIAFDCGSELVYFSLNSKGFCGILRSGGMANRSPCMERQRHWQGTGLWEHWTAVMEGRQQHRDLG